MMPNSPHAFHSNLIRDKSVKLVYKRPSKVFVDKNIKTPEKLGDPISDYISQRAFSWGLDPTIFKPDAHRQLGISRNLNKSGMFSQFDESLSFSSPRADI